MLLDLIFWLMVSAFIVSIVLYLMGRRSIAKKIFYSAILVVAFFEGTLLFIKEWY
jgi:hypothetical protein